ncbi:MAG: hypothetical protein ABIC95_05820 [archaeon]
MNIGLYWFSTILYGVAALLGLYQGLIGLYRANFVLVGIGVIITVVAMDNIFCVDRKHRYTVHKSLPAEPHPATTGVSVRAPTSKKSASTSRKRTIKKGKK